MTVKFLTTNQAALCLGISRTTLYDWLGLFDQGLLVIRGQNVTIQYFQSGKRGQGKILIEPSEIERLKEFLRVKPNLATIRPTPVQRQHFPGIVVPLGRPSPHS